MTENNNLIAYCGLYCGACSFKLANDENDRQHLSAMPSRYDKCKEIPLQFCPGCRLINQCDSCEIRDCAQDNQLSHCGLCEKFPCDKITEFNDDGVPHHAEVIENLKMLKDMGEERWLKYQERKWRCECGAKISWYVKNCFKCGKSIKARNPDAQVKE